MIGLGGKVAVVTGSGRGIGLAAARALAAAGAAVVVNDVDEQTALAAVAEIERAGGTAVAAVAAIGSAEAAELCVERALSAFGRLDAMCTNAGILRDRVLWNTDRRRFRCGDHDPSSRHLHLRARRHAPLPLATRRRTADPGRLHRGAARQFRPDRLCGRQGRDRGFRPHLVDGVRQGGRDRQCRSCRTRLPAWSQPCRYSRRPLPPPSGASAIPAKLRAGMGMGTAEDVAPLFVFLASDRSANITGQCIGIGGDKLSLWSHPQEIGAAYRDGGWTADAIAEAWGTEIGQRPETVGIEFDA